MIEDTVLQDFVAVFDWRKHLTFIGSILCLPVGWLCLLVTSIARFIFAHVVATAVCIVSCLVRLFVCFRLFRWCSVCYAEAWRMSLSRINIDE